MNCERARPLVPLYLDGALTEDQAAALRPHLLECASCRNEVQQEKSIKAWFVPTAPIPVPDGFAARVARRAMAGDTGEHYEGVAAEQSVGQGKLYHFVVQAVAIAALLLVTLSIAIRRLELPSGDLRATAPGFQDALDALEQMNDEEDLDEPPSDRAPSDRAPQGGEDE